MPATKRGKRSLLAESSRQHLQPVTSAMEPSALDSYHPYSLVTVTDTCTQSIPILSYQLNHLDAHPYQYSPRTSPMKDAIPSAPQASQAQVEISATAPTPSPGTPTIPRYERILPRQPSNTSSTILSFSSFTQPLSSANSCTTNTTSLPSAMPAMNLHALAPPPPSAADIREQERRKSHRAIERRRRDRINDKIIQLKRIIPACANQNNLHKLSILQGTIDYIQYLKDLVDEQQQQSQHTTSSQSTIYATERSQSPITRSPPPDNDRAQPSSSFASIDHPSVPVDIVNYSSSSPPRCSTLPPVSSFYSLSMGKSNHMKVDNLIS